MSNEKWKWLSVTYYVDEETGEQVDTSEIGKTYRKRHLIDSNVRYDNENYTKTVCRTMSVSKINEIQLNLF